MMKKCFLIHKWKYIVKESSMSYNSIERICEKCNKHQIKIDIGCADFRWCETNRVEGFK